MGRSVRLRRKTWDANPRRGILLVLIGAAGGIIAGCSDNIRPPTAAELADFKVDQPTGPSVDVAQISQAKIPSGSYRVVPGDVLQIEMPTMLDPQAGEANGVVKAASQTYTCRIRDDGTITLPLIGSIAVAGQSLSQIESAIAAAYHPKYVRISIPVYASVIEYRTHRVSIVGAVATPGIYRLRHDQMSLVALLMEAGNIVDNGAAVIEITHADPGDRGLPGAWATRDTEDRDARRSDATRLVFEREGPLRTTGWLSLACADESPVRRWLDLGNGPQRQAFMRKVVDSGSGVPVQDLDARLVHLATHLESGSVQQEPRSSLDGSGWQALARGRYAVVVGASGRQSPPSGGAGTDRADAETARVLLPVRGLNMPFVDVALQEGDSVSVQRPYQQSVAVVGLVNHPGNMPYPLDARYTLIEAIAFAGGLNLVADPRYVSIYRLQADGSVRGVTVQLVDPKRKQELTQAMSLVLRPGDVVSVENTLRTRTNVFFDRIFRISLGLYLTPDSLWNHD